MNTCCELRDWKFYDIGGWGFGLEKVNSRVYGFSISWSKGSDTNFGIDLDEFGLFVRQLNF